MKVVLMVSVTFRANNSFEGAAGLFPDSAQELTRASFSPISQDGDFAAVAQCHARHVDRMALCVL